MYSTEIIHFLQAFDQPIVFWLMWFFSFLGSTPMIATLCMAIAFGLDLKRGLVLINIVAWTAFTVFLLKSQISQPRPAEVDPKLSTEQVMMKENLHGKKADGDFLRSYSIELIDHSRNDAYAKYSFPSLHLAVQCSLWFSFLLLFHRRWILKFGVSIVLLTAVSRLYFAHQFPADLLGGLAVGLILPLLFLFFVKKTRYLKKQTHDNLSLSFFWLPWLFMPFAAYLPYWQMASTLGLNMAVILIVQRRNFPVFHVITWKRVLAAFLVLSSFLATYYLNKSVSFTSSAVLDFFIITLMNFLTISAVLSINRRLFLIKYRLAF